MITVAIVAVLTMVAMPSYQAYVRKSNRSAAQSFMVNVAAREEQVLLDQRSYLAVSNTGSGAFGGLNLTVPPETNGRYTFSVSLTSVGTCTAASQYCIVGTAIGNQVADGDLYLDSFGNKTPLAKWQ